MVQRTTNTANDFRLPDLGEGLEEAELIEWCVNVGQRVNENDVLAKMETAKALVEVPSPRAGTIAILHGKPGQAIKVGAPLVTYKDETEIEPAPEARSTRGNGAAHEERSDAGTVVGNLAAHDESGDEEGKVLAAPAVRRMAREMGVDLQSVTGTGIGGRITAADLRQAVAEDPDPRHRPIRRYR